MRRRCGSSFQKNGRARRAARRRRASAGRHGPVGTSGLQYRWSGLEDGPLPIPPPAGCGASHPVAGAANERRRFGYRRLFILLRREGEPSGVNRIHRLYREEGLSVRKRRARRKAVGARAPIVIQAKPNARWSTDFVHDQFANGRRFRILNIVDDVTKQCLGAIPDTSISGRRVARELTAIIERHGKPGMIVSDHGTEFTCKRYARLVPRQRYRLALHRAGKSRCRTASPTASTVACATSFLNETLFFDLDDARAEDRGLDCRLQ